MDYRDPEKSKITVKTTTPTELQNLLNTKPDLSLLDVRTPLEYTEVHVPHACNEPLDGLQPTVLFASGRLRKGQPIYLMGLLAGEATLEYSQAGLKQIHDAIHSANPRTARPQKSHAGRSHETSASSVESLIAG
jgi:rhodanese-related sulfurtransferase